MVIYPQFINPTPAVVADVRFRRALLHALNRQDMVDTFQGGLVPVADAYVSPTYPGYETIVSNIVTYDYAPQAAVQQLQDLGYARHQDGTLGIERMSGWPWRFEP
jgi:peptide/nickel transport system substrate-binding protein